MKDKEAYIDNTKTADDLGHLATQGTTASAPTMILT